MWQSSHAKFLRGKASSTFRSTMRTSTTGTMTKKPPTSYAISAVRSLWSLEMLLFQAFNFVNFTVYEHWRYKNDCNINSKRYIIYESMNLILVEGHSILAGSLRSDVDQYWLYQYDTRLQHSFKPCSYCHSQQPMHKLLHGTFRESVKCRYSIMKRYHMMEPFDLPGLGVLSWQYVKVSLSSYWSLNTL